MFLNFKNNSYKYLLILLSKFYLSAWFQQFSSSQICFWHFLQYQKVCFPFFWTLFDFFDLSISIFQFKSNQNIKLERSSSLKSSLFDDFVNFDVQNAQELFINALKWVWCSYKDSDDSDIFLCWLIEFSTLLIAFEKGFHPA